MPISRLTFAATGLSLALVASPVSAAWENTSWGASVEETLAVLGDDITTHKDRQGSRVWNQHMLISREGEFAGIPIVQEFYFEDGETLSIVRLQPLAPERCADFVIAVDNALGDSFHTETSDFDVASLSVSDFADAENDNVMRLASAKFRGGGPDRVTCHVTYQSYGNGTPGERP